MFEECHLSQYHQSEGCEVLGRPYLLQNLDKSDADSEGAIGSRILKMNVSILSHWACDIIRMSDHKMIRVILELYSSFMTL